MHQKSSVNHVKFNKNGKIFTNALLTTYKLKRFKLAVIIIN